MPQKKVPAFATLSCSFRANICSTDWPASVPKRVQQNNLGKSIRCYAVLCTKMDTDSAKNLGGLRAFRRQTGLSQEQLAKRLGISQSTVSRRERKPPQRHSDATAKLCRYAVQKAKKPGSIDRRAIQRAIDEIRKKSNAHAVALSEIIEAFVELCRSDCRD